MEQKLNLWQRCEALGPMEDQGVQLYRTDSGDYRIFIDRATVFHVHQDGTIGDYCRAWLAEAILSHFEQIRFPMPTIKPLAEMGDDEKAAFMKAMNEWTRGPMTFVPSESVVTIQNINEKLREALPKESHEPTPDQCYGLFTWVAECKKAIELKGFEVSGNVHTRELLVHDMQGTRGGFSITAQSFYGYHNRKNNNVQLTFEQACEMVGYTPLPVPVKLPDVTYVVEAPKPTEPTQEQLKAVWEHVMNLTAEQENAMGFWHMVHGTVTGVDSELHIQTVAACKKQWKMRIARNTEGVFSAIDPFDLAITCERLGCVHLANGDRVTESPNQFVSIPTEQWTELHDAFKTMAKVLCFEIKDIEVEQ